MKIRYNQEKENILKQKRNISFEEVKLAIDKKEFTITKNPKTGRENQYLIVF